MLQNKILTIIDQSNTHTVNITTETTLLSAILSLPAVDMNTPCGGNGSCGKCRIQIVQGSVTEPQAEELRLLSPQELRKGMRLACRTYPLATDGPPLVIRIPGNKRESQIMADFSATGPMNTLRFSVEEIVPEPPSAVDQKSLLGRVLEKTTPDIVFFEPESLRRLQRHLGDDTLRCLMDRGQIVSVLDENELPYGCAVDIGTTTVVVYLVNLLTGAVEDHRAELNNQRGFGADVISRIQAVSEQPDGSPVLQQAIVSQLDRMVADLFGAHGLPLSSLVELSAVGNTTMLHLLLGIDPASIAVAPFTPVFTQSLSYPLHQLGFNCSANGRIVLSRSIASYVGADISAGIYATAFTRQSEPVLFLDIGTNGEIVLWDGVRLYCCSSAAGPAFEGASILHGTGGVSGAISSVSVVTSPDGAIALGYETIDQGAPIGICGSGIIDATAILLNLGLMDETGAMISPMDDSQGLIVRTEHGTALSIVASDERPVYLTQKDIREIQLAKAAIAAGIRTLLAESGVALADLSSIIIAGGFGSYIDVRHAQSIGLLPPVPTSIMIFAGNAAGKGAVLTLIDPVARESMDRIAQKARYIELSNSAVFMEYYIDEMSFPSGAGDESD